MEPNTSTRQLTAVITGATTGVGLALALQLASAGHRLVLAARDPGRGQRAVEAVRLAAPRATVEHLPLDLGALRSIEAFAARLTDRPIDRLVLNAAVMTSRREATADGFEAMFGTNALGHHALVSHLWPGLRAASAPRVVTQSSESHRSGRLNFDDLQHERDFTPIQAYHDSKLAQHVLAVELARRDPHVQSVVAQPGWVVSELGRDFLSGGGPAVQRIALKVGNRLIGQSPDDGARAALRAVLEPSAPSADGGDYFTPSKLRRLRGAPHVEAADGRVLDRDVGRRLWAAATQLTGLEPDPRPS